MYTPIEPINHPTLIDVPIYVDSEQFTAAGMLSFLRKRYESVTASSLYYDPQNPSLSAKAGVSYLRSQYFTALSENPIKFRHHGPSVDMEVYVDTYTYIAKEPEIGEFDVNKRGFELKEGDRYERMTTGYVYQNVSVPEKSSKVWDGRHGLCVDSAGESISSGSQIEIIRGDVRAILEGEDLIPYTTLSLGGFAHTVKQPELSRYEAEYDVRFNAFLRDNYNAEGIPPIGNLGTVDKYEDILLPGETTGTGTRTRTPYERVSSSVAAELDGYYFKRWVTYNVYQSREIESE